MALPWILVYKSRSDSASSTNLTAANGRPDGHKYAEQQSRAIYKVLQGPGRILSMPECTFLVEGVVLVLPV